MTQSAAIAWKEWRESRRFLGVAWFVFIVLPIVGGFEGYLGPRHRFEFLASPWVYGLSPVLAVLLGVYCTCRDVQPKIQDFWQSRPITAARLFGIKYAVNAAVLLAAGVVPVAIELAVHRTNTPTDRRDLWLATMWVAAFSLAFAIGCIVRRAAHAATVGIVALLLLLVTPVIFPPLFALHIGQVEPDVSYRATPLQTVMPELKFAAGMLAISIVAAVIGALAVQREWKIDSSRPLIYTALSAAFLLLIGSASYQLGTNLPELAHVDLPNGTNVARIVYRRSQILAQCQTGHYVPKLASTLTTWSERPIEFTPQGLRLGLGKAVDPNWPPDRLRVSDVDPTVGYDADLNYDNHQETATLQIYPGLDRATPSAPALLQLWQVPAAHGYFAFLFVANRRLYVTGSRTIVFDISDPRHPRRLLQQPTTWRPFWDDQPDAVASFVLPPAPGLSPKDRLRFLIEIESGYGFAESDSLFDGSLWVRCLGENVNQTLAMYRLQSLTQTQAVFDRVAIYRPTLVQWIVGSGIYSSLSVRNHLLYATTGYRGVSVFDLAGPHPLRLIAHFVSRGQVRVCRPLPDGRILAAGSDLWLLGPPPGQRPAQTQPTR